MTKDNHSRLPRASADLDALYEARADDLYEWLASTEGVVALAIVVEDWIQYDPRLEPVLLGLLEHAKRRYDEIMQDQARLRAERSGGLQ